MTTPEERYMPASTSYGTPDDEYKQCELCHYPYCDCCRSECVTPCCGEAMCGFCLYIRTSKIRGVICPFCQEYTVIDSKFYKELYRRHGK